MPVKAAAEKERNMRKEVAIVVCCRQQLSLLLSTITPFSIHLFGPL